MESIGLDLADVVHAEISAKTNREGEEEEGQKTSHGKHCKHTLITNILKEINQ